jgi:two-component system response regulator HydG
MSAPSLSSGPSGARARILLVEADLTAMFVLRHVFALAGYDVDCAAGPGEGLRLLNRTRYAAVITDLDLLPGGCGEGLYLAAYARHQSPSACVVILTPCGTVLSDEDIQYSGVDICQRKPVDLGAVIAGVARVLGRQRIAAPDVRDASRAPDGVEGL